MRLEAYIMIKRRVAGDKVSEESNFQECLKPAMARSDPGVTRWLLRDRFRESTLKVYFDL